MEKTDRIIKQGVTLASVATTARSIAEEMNRYAPSPMVPGIGAAGGLQQGESVNALLGDLRSISAYAQMQVEKYRAIMEKADAAYNVLVRNSVTAGDPQNPEVHP